VAGGRPTTYNQEIAQKILDRIAEGESVSKICKDPDMPARSTVWLWSTTHEWFSSKYARAIYSLGQCQVDSVDDIEDKLLSGEIDAQTARVIIDSRKWKASKFYPKMYGDKQIVESKNENLNVNTKLPLTDADIAILERLGWKG
jgi:hypothetical protein